jgi:GrpB-like predicted nucleotidyltransferase (UPF0157 family)
MLQEPVVVAAYDPAWPILFETERQRLEAVFGQQACIEHMGSTSVPGLAAKPVIDMMVGAATLAAIERHISDLEALSYEYVPEFEVVMPERRYFCRNSGGKRTHQIHAVVVDGEFWKRHIAFRDHLRAHPETAAEYQALKHDLARRHRLDREAYTDAKGPFIRRVEAAAMQAGEG